MKNKLLLFVVLLCISTALIAQNSGYCGKRFSFHYNLYTMNALRFPNECGNMGVFSFNTLHHVDFDIAVARRLSLGLALEYMRTSLPYTSTLNYVDRDPYDYYNYGYKTFRSSMVGKMETFGLGFFLKRFFKGNIAPLGTYFKPQVTLLFTNIFPGNPKNSHGVALNDLNVHMSNPSPLVNVAISLELGQNRIFFKRMFIDYGVRLGIMPTASGFMESGIPSDLEGHDYLPTVAKARLSSHYLFNVKAGIGVLLF